MGIEVLNEGGRGGLAEKVTVNKDLEEREGAMRISRRKAFQAMGTASAKALRQESAWCV